MEDWTTDKDTVETVFNMIAVRNFTFGQRSYFILAADMCMGEPEIGLEDTAGWAERRKA